MSLVNQVLKDLEQRHANQAQADALGIEDLHYVPIAQVRVEKSRLWTILASVLIVLGVCTAVGGYLFLQWDKHQRTIAEALPQKISVVPSNMATAPVEKSQEMPAPALVTAKTPSHETVSKAAATSESVPVAKQPVIKQQMAKAASPVVKVTKSQSAEDQEDSGSMHKSVVPLSSEQRAERAYQEGYEHISTRQYRLAETALRRALALEPGHIKAREMLVGMYISQGRWIEASELLRNGLAMAPMHTSFRKLYARSLMELKREPQAIEVMTSHMPTPAQDADYYAILAALYQRQAKHEAAAQTYAQILKVRPQMGIWWVGMGISLEAMGQQAKAVAAYQHARKTGTLNRDVARYTDNRLLALDAINFPMD